MCIRDRWKPGGSGGVVTVQAPPSPFSMSYWCPLTLTCTFCAVGAVRAKVTRESPVTRGYRAPITLDGAGCESSADCARHRPHVRIVSVVNINTGFMASPFSR